MQISQSDAAGALRDVESAQSRSAEVRGYHRASPYLIGWGVIWAIGYTLMAQRPVAEWGLIWLPLDLVGITGCIALGLRDRRSNSARSMNPGTTWRALAGGLFVAMFVVATLAIFKPMSLAPAIVFPGMVAGTVYVAIGIFVMPRIALIGFAMFALSLIGFFFLPNALLYWMAAVGGGGLVLGGLWLRSA